MKTFCTVGEHKLILDERAGDTLKVITPNYEAFRDLGMTFMYNDWFEKWININDVDTIWSEDRSGNRTYIKH